MFYVYVLESKKDGRFYTGFTDNLRKRMVKHNEGKVFSTNQDKPCLKQGLYYYFEGKRCLLTENT